jgi:Rieske Fe-S protein
MLRRTFLACGLILVGFKQRVWAQLAGRTEPRYHALTKPIRVPLAAVATPWKTVPFKAEAVAQRSGTTPRRVLMDGVLFRREGAQDPLSALCLTCPHEQCLVDLITQPPRLATMKVITGHPMFQCGCHESEFDALDDGAVVAGEAPRGLYRFQVNIVSGDIAEVTAVEEVALFEV